MQRLLRSRAPLNCECLENKKYSSMLPICNSRVNIFIKKWRNGSISRKGWIKARLKPNRASTKSYSLLSTLWASEAFHGIICCRQPHPSISFPCSTYDLSGYLQSTWLFSVGATWSCCFQIRDFPLQSSLHLSHFM